MAVVDIDGDRAQVVARASTPQAARPSRCRPIFRRSRGDGGVESTVARFGRLDVLHNNAALTDSDFLSRDTR